MTDNSVGIWYLLGHTPLSDVLRGRLTGRLDWQAVVTKSGLPAEVQRLLLDVLQRTRVRRHECADVAHELVAHFRDGLRAGRATEELISKFGDVWTTARLIRRAKIRQRSLLARVLIRSVAAFVCIYVAVWGMQALERPQFKIDYLAQLNTIADTTAESTHAWPLYRRAWIAARLPEVQERMLHVHPSYERVWRPGERGFAEAATFIKAHADLLAVMREGAQLPHLGFRLDFAYDGDDFQALYAATDGMPQRAEWVTKGPLNTWLAGLGLPHLRHMHRMARWLAVDMLVASTENDGARIVADYTAALGLARQVREGAMMYGQSAGRRMLQRTNHILADIVHTHPDVLEAAQLTELAHLAAAAIPQHQLEWQAEQVLVDDYLQRMFSDDGTDNGRLTLPGLQRLSADQVLHRHFLPHDRLADLWLLGALPVVRVAVGSRRDIAQWSQDNLARAQQEAQLPLWELLRTPLAPRRPMQTGLGERLQSVMGYDLAWPAADYTRSFNLSTRIGDAYHEALVIALALELYYRRDERYPDGLAELAPHYLPQVPVDHSTGLPLLYKLADGKPLLYGRGKDGDDDGGVRPAVEATTLRVPATDDWVLYPPWIERAE